MFLEKVKAKKEAELRVKGREKISFSEKYRMLIEMMGKTRTRMNDICSKLSQAHNQPSFRNNGNKHRR